VLVPRAAGRASRTRAQQVMVGAGQVLGSEKAGEDAHPPERKAGQMPAPRQTSAAANCSSSVEPRMAPVEALPLDTTFETSSK
jgi:hypothetical protein